MFPRRFCMHFRKIFKAIVVYNFNGKCSKTVPIFFPNNRGKVIYHAVVLTFSFGDSGIVSVKSRVEQYVFLAALGTFYLYYLGGIKLFVFKLFNDFFTKQALHCVKVRNTVLVTKSNTTVFFVEGVVCRFVCRFFCGTHDNIFISNKMPCATFANNVTTNKSLTILSDF